MTVIGPNDPGAIRGDDPRLISGREFEKALVKEIQEELEKMGVPPPPPATPKSAPPPEPGPVLIQSRNAAVLVRTNEEDGKIHIYIGPADINNKKKWDNKHTEEAAKDVVLKVDMVVDEDQWGPRLQGYGELDAWEAMEDVQVTEEEEDG